ncbi:hypothetical protein LVJ94_04145 [Pendulispora rubella]|uniref:Uncharacterized protein n=1 Tax=Pendulispora rubella TaxID=2741070 RepID=A0ABZ2LB61_9BACT
MRAAFAFGILVARLLAASPSHADVVDIAKLPTGAGRAPAFRVQGTFTNLEDNSGRTFRAPPDGTCFVSFVDRHHFGRSQWLAESDIAFRSTEVYLMHGDPDASEAFGVERLVRTREGSKFERALVLFGPKTAPGVTIQRAVSIPLVEILHDARGLLVLGYRTATAVHVVVRSRPKATITQFDENGVRLESGSQGACTVSDIRLPLRDNGAFAQMHASLDVPHEKAPVAFVLNASVTQSSRDPSPVLSLAVRYSKSR